MQMGDDKPETAALGKFSLDPAAWSKQRDIRIGHSAFGCFRIVIC
jgi:hypothetical protein